MGEFTNVILFCMVFAFAFFLFTGNTAPDTSTGTSWTQYISTSVLSQSNLALALLAASTIAIASSILFPNPYTVFAGVLGLLLSLVTMASDIFKQFSAVYGIDANILSLITALIGTYLTLKLIDWYRTGGNL